MGLGRQQLTHINREQHDEIEASIAGLVEVLTVDQVGAYTGRWPHALAVKKDPAGFVRETNKVFQLLSQRIQKENEELYAVVEEN